MYVNVLKSPTPELPHSTILPLAHFPEVTQLIVYPLVWLSQREASPSSHSLTFWWLTSQRKLHQAPIAHLEVAQLTFSSNSLISWKPFPVRSCFLLRSATSCPHTAGNCQCAVDFDRLANKGKKCCGKRLDLIIDYLFDDETFVFFSLFFVCLLVCSFIVLPSYLYLLCV